MKTLVLVDIQNDFLPGGALPVKESNKIIPLIKELVELPFDRIIASKDWHPVDHGSFAINHNKKPGDHVNLGGVDQTLWPVHCVQGTWGSEFAPGWDSTQIEKVIYKGTNSNIDSYSIFFDNAHRKETGLEAYLRSVGIKTLYIAGLATDYCVKFSVLDALQLGFDPIVIVDACKGVNLDSDDSAKALEEMVRAGAKFTSFSDLMKEMKK